VSAADRARWLAELARVLDEAQEMMKHLVVTDARRAEALDLLARLEAARAEVQALRRGRVSELSEEFDPEWRKPFPWDRPRPNRVG